MIALITAATLLPTAALATAAGNPRLTAQGSKVTVSEIQGQAPLSLNVAHGVATQEADCQARVDKAREAGSTRPVACVTWQAASAQAIRPQAALPLPSWCDDHGADSKWWMIRTQACMITPASLTVTNPQTGGAVGGINYLVYAYTYTDTSLLDWGYQIQLGMVSSWGAVAGTQASGTGACKGKCKVTDASFPAQSFSMTHDAVGNWIMKSTIATRPKGQRGTGTGQATWNFTNPQWDGPSTDMTLGTLDVRCDHALPGNTKPGCVMPQYIPQMVYSKSGAYPELAKHIEYAQNTKKLPGKHGTTKYLTRLTDAAKIKKNRNKACPSSLHRPAGKSCDEYPFASTWQGASTGNGTYSRRMINATQNKNGGVALANFYIYNRILEKDKFLVWIKS